MCRSSSIATMILSRSPETVRFGRKGSGPSNASVRLRMEDRMFPYNPGVLKSSLGLLANLRRRVKESRKSLMLLTPKSLTRSAKDQMILRTIPPVTATRNTVNHSESVFVPTRQTTTLLAPSITLDRLLMTPLSRPFRRWSLPCRQRPCAPSCEELWPSIIRLRLQDLLHV